MDALSVMSVEELTSVFEREGIDLEVIDSLTENCVDGATLVALSKDFDEFKDLIPKAGIRMKVKSLMQKLQASSKDISLDNSDELDLMEGSSQFHESFSSNALELSLTPTRPNISSAKTSDHPAKTTAHPATTDHPAETTDHPAETTDHPAETTDHPAETIDHPATAIDHPVNTSTPKQVKKEKKVNEPVASTSWAYNLSIPTRFSSATMESIETKVLTGKARDEIIASLSTVMLLYTTTPTSSDYNIICDRLVKKIPVLKDVVGSGYDSWKKKLRNRFKNIRRPQRAEKFGLPPAKKAKTGDIEDAESKEPRAKVSAAADPSSSDTDEYLKHIKRIQKLYSGRKWVASQFSLLLSETYTIRRKWIIEDTPGVLEVLEKFPCLKESNLFLEEFVKVVGLLPDGTDCLAIILQFQRKWKTMSEKVLTYSAIDSRTAVKQLNRQYLAREEDNTDDRVAVYSFVVLQTLLVCKGKTKSNTFFLIEGEVVDVNEELNHVLRNVTYPCIVAFGESMDNLVEFRVCVEGNSVLKVSNFNDCIHCWFAAFWIFNISYPTASKSLLLFMENAVYGLSTSKKLPTTVVTLIDSMTKICV